MHEYHVDELKWPLVCGTIWSRTLLS